MYLRPVIAGLETNMQYIYLRGTVRTMHPHLNLWDLWVGVCTETCSCAAEPAGTEAPCGAESHQSLPKPLHACAPDPYPRAGSHLSCQCCYF
jgi:hypothetical protein